MILELLWRKERCELRVGQFPYQPMTSARTQHGAGNELSFPLYLWCRCGNTLLVIRSSTHTFDNALTNALCSTINTTGEHNINYLLLDIISKYLTFHQVWKKIQNGLTNKATMISQGLHGRPWTSIRRAVRTKCQISCHRVGVEDSGPAYEVQYAQEYGIG